MKTSLSVNNMQCGHCVATINKELLKVNGVFGVEANIAEQTLSIDHTDDVDVAAVKTVISTLGYAPKISTDAFAAKAAEWDENPARVEMATTFFRRVVENVAIQPSDVALDFGCGTGLVGLQLVPYVQKVVMVDNSPAMLDILRQKCEKDGLSSSQVELVEGSMEEVSATNLKLIVTLMALHHVVDTKSLLQQFYNQLNKGGYLAIGDLQTEDGSFHAEKVPHNGFDPHDVCAALSIAGFQLMLCETFHKMNKPTEKGKRSFTQFLILAKK